jgi:alpha-D-ribose 1-methylphosphonate 5-triphosphate diphosphatase PhnM
MSMDVTVGYGGSEPPEKPRTTFVRPTFVVKGSETMAALEDEGWGDVEHEFFVGGVVIDGMAKRSSPRPKIDWTRIAGVTAIIVLGLTAVIVAVAG